MSFLSFKLLLCALSLTVIPVCSLPRTTPTASHSLAPQQEGLPEGTVGGGSRYTPSHGEKGDRYWL